MHIRTLVPADAAAFVAMRLRGLRECPQAFASSFDEECSTPIADIEQRLQPRPDSAVFGAFADEELRGMVGIQREHMVKLAHKAFIWGMYVAPDARAQGTGSRILQHALHHAATVMGVRQVNLGVNTRNLAAVALYRKLGFVEYGLERGFLIVGDELHDEYHMAWHAPGSRHGVATLGADRASGQSVPGAN